ncbi:S24 family peptidase [Muribaculaceae bacterium Isolate-114 (HZI)]|nr:S24 family peptidase [Muribaculaceae bacterium Isolate-114 (HZI)]
MNVEVGAKNLKEAYKYLRSIGKIHTQKDLADLMKSTPSNISKAMSGDPRFFTEKFIKRFNRHFNGIFNEKWLMGDEIHESMLRDRIDTITIPVFYREEDQQIQTDGDCQSMSDRGYKLLCYTTYPEWDVFSFKIRTIRSNTSDFISMQLIKELWIDYSFHVNQGDGDTWVPPHDILLNNNVVMAESDSIQEIGEDIKEYVHLLPVEAMAGPLQGYSEGVALRDCKKIKSPVSGADWAIQISGDSMEPEYKSGSYLFIKKMTGSFIPWGHVLVLDTMDGVVVKKIYQIDDTDEFIEARSINPKYPPFRIETSCILGIYRVLGGTFIYSTI